MIMRLYEKIKPWIVNVGMTIYIIIPGGSIVLLVLFLIFPNLFRDEVKKLWQTTKTVLKKIGMIKC